MQIDITFNPDVGGRFKEAYMYLRNMAIVHTQKEFAQLLGSNEGNVSRLFRGDNRYTTSSMASRISAASGISFNEEYLLNGEGTLLREGADVQPTPKKPYHSKTEIETIAPGSRTVQRLPVIPIEAQAGIGKGFLYDRDLSQDPDDVYDRYDSMEVVLEREASDKYKLFRVKGDSMTDGSLRSICSGDVILCREVFPEDWKLGLTNNRYPNVVIVIEEEGILLKQLTKHSKKQGTISLHSINPSYEDFTVDLKDVRAFYYVERIIDRSVAQW